MGTGTILQIIMILVGIFLLWVSINSLAKRKMTEPICLTWGLVAIIVMAAGIFLNPTELSRYISTKGLVMLVLIGFCVLYIIYYISSVLSLLMRKNTELAMQVSLLNQENEEIRRQIKELMEKEEQEESDEKDTLCN